MGLFFIFLKISQRFVVSKGYLNFQQWVVRLIGQSIYKLLLKECFDFANDQHFAFLQNAITIGCVERV